MRVNLADYVSAGYYLSRYTGERDCTGIGLRRITMANDHSQRRFFPSSWTISWCGDKREERIGRAADFGISEHDLDGVLAWGTSNFEKTFAAWSVFFSLDDARTAARTMLSGARNLDLWGVGLHRDLARSYCDATRPPPPEPGFAPWGASGTHLAVCERRAVLSEGGEPLGHEMLVDDFGCEFNSAESLHLDEAAAIQAAGGAANAYGLIDSFGDALACCRHLGSAKDLEPHGRRSDWLPWLIVRYPLD